VELVDPRGIMIPRSMETIALIGNYFLKACSF
jgi:hypothetical protein